MKPKAIQVCIGHPSVFQQFEIERFETEILNNPSATEHDASRFFSENPKFLLLGEGKELRRETVLFGATNAPIGRIDFFRRSYGRLTWDIVELKRPQVEVMGGGDTNHPYLSRIVQRAVSQAQDYRRWIEISPSIRHNLRKMGINVYLPRLIVVAGRQHSEASLDTAAELVDRLERAGVHLVTYDDVYAFAKEHYESNHIIMLPADMAPNSAELIVKKIAEANVHREDYKSFLELSRQLHADHGVSVNESDIFSSLANTLPSLVFTKDASRQFRWVNENLAKVLGKTVDEMIGKTDADLFSEDLAEEYRKSDEMILKTGINWEGEKPYIAPKGKIHHIRTVKFPIHQNPGDSNDDIVGIAGMLLTNDPKEIESLWRHLLEEDKKLLGGELGLGTGGGA